MVGGPSHISLKGHVNVHTAAFQYQDAQVMFWLTRCLVKLQGSVSFFSFPHLNHIKGPKWKYARNDAVTRQISGTIRGRQEISGYSTKLLLTCKILA